MNPSEVGVVLVYIVQVLGVLAYDIELSGQVENLVMTGHMNYILLILHNFYKKKTFSKSKSKMTSVERINEYASLDDEESSTNKLKPSLNWPENGQISFENVSFAYDKNLPDALKNVSFKLNAKEKVGVVGRTGAGKSTIFQTLFRMAEPQGTVAIDGINIKDISLSDLRNKISIIPVSLH